MSDNSWIKRMSSQEQLNFLLTNRIPRRFSTIFMGKFSRIRNPFVTRISLGIWKRFADDLRLHEAKKTRFESLHDCFIRELKDGARPIEKSGNIGVSPCDAVVGEFGKIEGTEVLQAKGFPYTLEDLLGNDRALSEKYRDGEFITLRLKSSMYHRFHAPLPCRVREVNYISGDTWNVNPIALKRVEKLFCKNERSVLDLELKEAGKSMALVPVAAILVASMRLHCLDQTFSIRYQGPNRMKCDAVYQKGDELGYFQHGSTIVVLTKGFKVTGNIEKGKTIRMGQPLVRFI